MSESNCFLSPGEQADIRLKSERISELLDKSKRIENAPINRVYSNFEYVDHV